MSARDPLAYVLGCGAAACVVAVIAGGIAGYVLLRRSAEAAAPDATTPAATVAATSVGPTVGEPAPDTPAPSAGATSTRDGDAPVAAPLDGRDPDGGSIDGGTTDAAAANMGVDASSADDGGATGIAPVAPPRDVLVALDAVDGIAADRAVLQGFPPGLRECYLRSAEEAPATMMRVRLRGEIEASGSVALANVVSESAPAAMQACMAARMRAAQFPPGAARSVGLTLRFTPVRN